MNIAAIDESPSTVGIADSGLYFTDNFDDVLQRLDLMESLGVRNVRLLVPWIFIQPNAPVNGSVNWDQDLQWDKLDQIVQEVERRGMGILGVLQWSPAWHRRPDGHRHPRDLQVSRTSPRPSPPVPTRLGVRGVERAETRVFLEPLDPGEYTGCCRPLHRAEGGGRELTCRCGGGAVQNWATS
jgi:hypothetical protein